MPDQHDQSWRKDWVTDEMSWQKKLNKPPHQRCDYPDDQGNYGGPAAKKFSSGMGGRRFLKRRREQR
jgi:hypothetical protein